MVTEKLKPAPTKEKKDWIPALAIGGGGLALGFGLWFFLKKPPGIDPGDSFMARFTAVYSGEPGIPYVLQISFGTKWPLVPVFDREETMPLCTMEVIPETTGPQQWDMTCEIPETAKPHQYDAEALIRTPDMGDRDYLVKVYKEAAITVREP
jgi:hypothetical protein